MHVPRDAEQHRHKGTGGRHRRTHHAGWLAWLAVLACAVVVVMQGVRQVRGSIDWGMWAEQGEGVRLCWRTSHGHRGWARKGVRQALSLMLPSNAMQD